MKNELLDSYIEMLRDQSVPSCRVVRKVAFLTAGVVCTLVYYRHVVLGFGLWAPAFQTLLLALLAAVVLGIFGGIGAGSFYDAFLRKVGAQHSAPSVVTFFAEWLFAATAPIFGLIIYALVAAHEAQ